VTKLAAVPVTAEIERYIEGLLPERDPLLTRIEHEIEVEDVHGVGAQVGSLLQLLLRLAGAKRVLELGTAVGYSGIWLLRGTDGGSLVTLEQDPARAGRARANFAEAGFEEQAQVLEEDAIAYLERPGDGFDAVFNDLLNSFPSEAVAERSFELSLARLRPGGLLIADNALRRGEVVRPRSRGARNVNRYNRLVAASPRLDPVLITVRDGLSVARVRG